MDAAVDNAVNFLEDSPDAPCGSLLVFTPAEEMGVYLTSTLRLPLRTDDPPHRVGKAMLSAS
jgi:hypothetical protein